MILKKGGITSLSGSVEPDDHYCVIAHAAPFFTLSLQTDHYAPVVVYAENPVAQIGVLKFRSINTVQVARSALYPLGQVLM